MKITKILEDINSERIVKKLIFEWGDKIVETVAYRYSNRVVICFSCQSGCPVGCVFCGTGKKFIGSLTYEEMMFQINSGLKSVDANSNDKIQIMAMSMGDPSLNKKEIVDVANDCLREHWYFFISTVGIKNVNFRELYHHSRFGLQFSLHDPIEESRTLLLGNYPNLESLENIKEEADLFSFRSGNPAYFNLIVDRLYSDSEMRKLAEIVKNHHLTISVKCSTEGLKNGDMDIVKEFATKLAEYEIYNYSIFNPAGQDTIGGGCGQLLYVQEKLKWS